MRAGASHRRWLFAPVPALVAALVLAAGCSGAGGDAAWGGTEEQLPNGAVLVRSPAEGLWAAGGNWRLREELRLGETEGEGPQVFGRLTQLEVDVDGRIWVYDAQASEVRVFGGDGVHVASFGRSGGGPGEFRGVTGLLADPRGGVWVVDAGNRRYTRYGPDGAVREERARESAAAFSSVWLALLDDGRLYDVDLLASPESGGAGPMVSPMMAAAGLGNSDMMIMRAMFDVDGGEPLDTVRLPQQSRPVAPFSANGAFLGVPWSPLLITTIDARGHVWFGESDEYRIHQRRFAGDTVRILERPYDRLPVRADEIDAWLEGPGPTRFRERGGQLDRSRIPSLKPVFEQLRVDDRGALWVRLVAADSAVSFDVFGEDGRYLGAVAGPPGLQLRPPPVIRGDRFYGVVADSLDLVYVVRLRIEGRGGS